MNLDIRLLRAKIILFLPGYPFLKGKPTTRGIIMYLEKIRSTNAPNISGISDEQRAEALAFLQGAVYVWCQVKCTEKFAARDLVGGKNWNWEDTPLQCIYEAYKKSNEETAEKVAAQAVGRLLNWLINEDKRNFSDEKQELVMHYTWDGVYEEKG